MYLFNAVGYWVCAAAWLINGLRDRNAFGYLLALVWLAGGILNFLRYRKERKKSEEEKEHG